MQKVLHATYVAMQGHIRIEEDTHSAAGAIHRAMRVFWRQSSSDDGHIAEGRVAIGWQYGLQISVSSLLGWLGVNPGTG